MCVRHSNWKAGWKASVETPVYPPSLCCLFILLTSIPSYPSEGAELCSSCRHGSCKGVGVKMNKQDKGSNPAHEDRGGAEVSSDMHTDTFMSAHRLKYRKQASVQQTLKHGIDACPNTDSLHSNDSTTLAAIHSCYLTRITL